jgi:hypothetical protein
LLFSVDPAGAVCKIGAMSLRDVLRPRRTTIDYLYDYGDSWKHRLTVTSIRAGDPEASYPRYVRGEKNAPPEGCGGLFGFYDMLDALADPNHPDHAEVTERTDGYDPETVDEMRIKLVLGRIADSRNAATAMPPSERQGSRFVEHARCSPDNYIPIWQARPKTLH